MTREEAREYFKHHMRFYCVTGVCREAEEMAVEEFKKKPCEDAISREAVLDILARYEDAEELAGVLIRVIKQLPPVTPKQRTGHWITKDRKEQGYDICGVKTWYIQIMCSECGFIKTAIEGHTGQYHYCPSCGAKMVEP